MLMVGVGWDFEDGVTKGDANSIMCGYNAEHTECRLLHNSGSTGQGTAATNAFRNDLEQFYEP